MIPILALLLVQDLFRAAEAKGAALVTDVRDGAVVTSLDADRRVLPLSLVKLWVAAIWWDRGLPGSLDDMLVEGLDQPGKDRAIELRKRFGGKAVLADLERYGLALTIKADASDAEWGETLSIGERNVTVTPGQVSAFLRTIARSKGASKLRAAMLACVERGTARGARQAAGRLGGKTGSGPALRQPLDGAFAGLVFVEGEPRYTVYVYVDGKGLGGGVAASIAAGVARSLSPASCFLESEIGGREIAREGALCATRLSPASTFKIPHALAALDSGVVSGPGFRFAYDGSPQPFEAWRRDHTLASGIRYSVVWVFQRIAQMLGPEREREYLRRLSYGNADPSSGLTTFWLGGSLLISPEEQRDFLLALWRDQLPVKPAAMRAVREMLVQPKDVVVNATGERPFPSHGAILSAKTGSAGLTRWLVGQVGARVFVACVDGDPDPDAAITLARSRLADPSAASPTR